VSAPARSFDGKSRPDGIYRAAETKFPLTILDGTSHTIMVGESYTQNRILSKTAGDGITGTWVPPQADPCRLRRRYRRYRGLRSCGGITISPIMQLFLKPPLDVGSFDGNFVFSAATTSVVRQFIKCVWVGDFLTELLKRGSLQRLGSRDGGEVPTEL